ncbi:SDR family oxidoreductase [Thalassomonas actiniarum]|uniref:SDR family oxidoreductase n=1 Tax=Thalassomonas actiniarum TaxID=485447 RepID=A0AAF0C1S9_9GAMM|nr:SDR family oxidoreductase [Thalassomonas actiniarum]WDD97075.1 SDR family oxidoreductase [Thalassomonas actiniarum]
MSGKRVFITGGASGLGKAIACKYAGAGYRVCIGDVNEKRGLATIAELTASGCDAFFVHCNTTRLEDLTQVKEQIISRWQGLDLVVNNAGIAGTAGPIDQVALDDWQQVLDVNLLGVVRGCQTFTPLFKQQGFGYFVNIASAAGLMNAPQMSSYNVSKAGVIALSETLKHELAPFNIGISVACPAFFKTNLAESMKSTIDGLSQRLSRLMARSAISAEDIADDIFTAVESGSFWVLPHKAERRLWLLKRYLPFAFDVLMKKKIAKLFTAPRPATTKTAATPPG